MIVQHVSGILLKVISSNELVSTCEYVNDKDYIHSKFMGVESVTKICIVLNQNIKQIKIDHFVDANEMITEQLKLEL